MISVFFRSSPLTLVLELVFSLLVVSLNRFLLCSLNWQAPSGGQQSSSCCDYSVIPIDFVLFFALLKNSHNCAKSLQLCLILCDPPPGSSVHGILQARILERVAILFSRRFSWPSDQTCLLHWQAGSLPLVPHGKPILLRILQLWFLHPWDKLQLMRPFIIRTAHIFHVSFVEPPTAHTLPSWTICFQPQPMPIGTLPSMSLCIVFASRLLESSVPSPSLGRPFWLLTGRGVPTMPFLNSLYSLLDKKTLCCSYLLLILNPSLLSKRQEGQVPCLFYYCIHSVWP